MPEYPECEKMLAVREDSQKLGDFIDWLSSERSLCIAVYVQDDILVPTSKSIEQILADYFGIDMNRVEDERSQMLHELAERVKHV